MPALLKQLNQFNAINSATQLHFLYPETEKFAVFILISVLVDIIWKLA
jgi:hypothetical protein